jgi:hypothetical protein
MTIDHLAAYGFKIPLFAEYSTRLRQLGRIAAPLFLFMVVESVRHTRNKPKFILRLYIAGVCTGLFVTATNFFLGDIVGVFSNSNIIFTFFYTAVYICLIEQTVIAVKEKKAKQIIKNAILILSTFIPIFLNLLLRSVINDQWSRKYIFLTSDLIESFLPVNLNVEYSMMFIIMGIVLYFARKKYIQCAVFTGFCILYYFAAKQHNINILNFFSIFYNSRQYLMIMALPFMLLYNGMRGKEHKQFFYVYYPLHRYIISIIQMILTR